MSSLSNVGGGGGGVVQALQSGVLRFFDEYSYDKLGIRCRLRGDVCEMSGVEPAPNGYYIVKGSGIPRIDIVGNQGRVNWNQLMSSIATADFGGTTVQIGRWTRRAFGPIIARTFDVWRVQDAFIGATRSCPRPDLRLESRSQQCVAYCR